MLSRVLFLLKRRQSELGFLGLIRFILQRVFSVNNGRKIATLRALSAPSIDIQKVYDFVRSEPVGQYLAEADLQELIERRVNWVIPAFGIGSGGHINIFRFIGGLERSGYKCHITIIGDHDFSSAEEARKSINKNFEPLNSAVSLGLDDIKPAWITVATSWQTAYAVKSIRPTKHKAYFIQDFEPQFYAHGSEYFFAEETYKFGFKGITAGDWLSNKLASEYGMECNSVGFSYDKERYLPTAKRDASVKRVFFYSRPPTPRRAFELGVLVLSEVFKRNPNVEFVLAGWDDLNYKLPFPHSNAGLLSLDDLPDVYSQLDAALVISSTNLSLLPLELMACNCAVISNSGPNVEWLLKDGENASVVNADVDSLASAINKVLDDDKYRCQLIEKAAQFAHETSWLDEIERFVKIIETFDER